MHTVAGIDSLTQDCSDGTSTTREPRLLVGTCKVVGLKENSDPGEPCKKPPNYEMPEARFLPGAKV